MSNILKNQLEESFAELIARLSSIDENQFNTVPFEGSWSAGQLADHLLKSYDASSVLKGTTRIADRPFDEKVPALREIFLNFETKMESPDFIMPSSDPIDQGTMLKELQKRMSALVSIADEDDLSLLCLDWEFPYNGHLTRFEWISFITFHTTRHTRQLKNIIDQLDRVEI